MGTVYVFLAAGFEEIEAISIIDVLRRAGISVKTISITNSLQVCGAHGVPVVADELFENADCLGGEMIVLPGGMPGATGLDQHIGLRELILDFAQQHKPLAAICAAPLVYGKLGLLKDKKATCYPGFEKYLNGASLQDEAVVRDGLFITAEGPCAAIPFALCIVDFFLGGDKVKELSSGMLLK